MTDSEIISFIKHVRKTPIWYDLLRHEFFIFKIRLGISKYFRVSKYDSKKDIVWLSEWCRRLKSIIRNYPHIEQNIEYDPDKNYDSNLKNSI